MKGAWKRFGVYRSYQRSEEGFAVFWSRERTAEMGLSASSLLPASRGNFFDLVERQVVLLAFCAVAGVPFETADWKLHRRMLDECIYMTTGVHVSVSALGRAFSHGRRQTRQ